jgi:outer membrane biosynthesis protein TonB
MQPRSERQKILWAVFLSLLLHLVVGVSIASFGDKLQPSLPEDEKPAELTIVDVAPMPTPPTGPKNTPFIDTTEQTETKEEPKEKTFESNANSIAASGLAAVGIARRPPRAGKELPTMDLKNRQHSLDGEGAQAQPVSRPAPVPSIPPQATPQPTPTPSPSSTPSSTPQPTPTSTPTPTPTGDLLAMFRASPPPTARTPGPEKEVRSPPPKAAPAQVSRPPASSAYRREQIQERMAGNISKRGVSSVNAVGTPLGRYEKKIYDAIGKRWYALCDANRDRVDIGTVHVQFVVAPSGKINDIKVTSGGTSESFTNLCLQSIQEAKPEAIPEDVMAVLPPDGLPGEISFTGFQNP